jgi:hypothetical protein
MKDKISRYDWAVPGDDGKYQCIPVADLKIDHSYQRAEVGDTTILAIARNFKWSAFGVLVVMERANGTLYVVDGQQRLAAVKRRGDIEKVPCMVFQSTGKDHEAQAFLDLNTARKKVSAHDKFIAAARANIDPAKSIAAWLRAEGFILTRNGHTESGIAFPGQLVKSWVRNEATAKEALLIQRELSADKTMAVPVHLGIDYLLRSGIPVRDEIPKLIAEGGKERLLGAIRNESRNSNVADSDRVCGIGVLSVMNYRRKNRKYRLGADSE